MTQEQQRMCLSRAGIYKYSEPLANKSTGERDGGDDLNPYDVEPEMQHVENATDGNNEGSFADRAVAWELDDWSEDEPQVCTQPTSNISYDPCDAGVPEVAAHQMACAGRPQMRQGGALRMPPDGNCFEH